MDGCIHPILHFVPINSLQLDLSSTYPHPIPPRFPSNTFSTPLSTPLDPLATGHWRHHDHHHFGRFDFKSLLSHRKIHSHSLIGHWPDPLPSPLSQRSRLSIRLNPQSSYFSTHANVQTQVSTAGSLPSTGTLFRASLNLVNGFNPVDARQSSRRHPCRKSPEQTKPHEHWHYGLARHRHRWQAPVGRIPRFWAQEGQDQGRRGARGKSRVGGGWMCAHAHPLDLLAPRRWGIRTRCQGASIILLSPHPPTLCEHVPF